jgi:hypothetical protein
LGGIASLATFLPRPSISLVDPVDPDNPFSSRFTITNNGFVPLTDVSVGIHFQHIQIGNSKIMSPERKKGDAATLGVLTRDTWQHLYLGMDDSLTIPLSDVIGPNGVINSADPGGFKDGDVSIIVNYYPWYIPKRRTKEFRVHARRESNGKFYWNVIPPPN